MTNADYMREYRKARRAGSGNVVLCACGCGIAFLERDGYNGRLRRYVHGHNKNHGGKFSTDVQPRREPATKRSA